MNPRIKGSLVIFLLLLMFLSAGIIKGSGVGTNPLHLLHKVNISTSHLLFDCRSHYISLLSG
ncbi:hypothetical protein Pfo_014648 [Paulownia fortunei]|nr:hypothetical protein Pfo_014648 [Paulownia fortunei]